RHAAHGVYALYARDPAERTCGPDGLRGKEQPGYRIRRGGVCTFLRRADDLAAVGGFPVRTGVVPADAPSALVEEIGFRRDERPLVRSRLALPRAAFVDL